MVLRYPRASTYRASSALGEPSAYEFMKLLHEHVRNKIQLSAEEKHLTMVGAQETQSSQMTYFLYVLPCNMKLCFTVVIKNNKQVKAQSHRR
ncbi:hypothetical protein Nmel_012385 [Mimus melanotis]